MNFDNFFSANYSNLDNNNSALPFAGKSQSGASNDSTYINKVIEIMNTSNTTNNNYGNNQNAQMIVNNNNATNVDVEFLSDPIDFCLQTSFGQPAEQDDTNSFFFDNNQIDTNTNTPQSVPMERKSKQIKKVLRQTPPAPISKQYSSNGMENLMQQLPQIYQNGNSAPFSGVPSTNEVAMKVSNNVAPANNTYQDNEAFFNDVMNSTSPNYHNEETHEDDEEEDDGFSTSGVSSAAKGGSKDKRRPQRNLPGLVRNAVINEVQTYFKHPQVHQRYIKNFLSGLTGEEYNEFIAFFETFDKKKYQADRTFNKVFQSLTATRGGAVLFKLIEVFLSPAGVEGYNLWINQKRGSNGSKKYLKQNEKAKAKFLLRMQAQAKKFF